MVLWVRLDADALRGAMAPVPLSLVEQLGLSPGNRRTFAGRYGPVTLQRDGDRACRGSVRAVALAAGAGVDDTLMLRFSAHGAVGVDVRRRGGGNGTEDVPATGAHFPNVAVSRAP